MKRLTNIEIGCLYLYLRTVMGSPCTNGADLRRAIYQQRHGSLEGFHRGTYCGYTSLGACSSWSQPGKYWSWNKPPTGSVALILTDKGLDVAFRVLRRFKHECGVRVWPKKRITWMTHGVETRRP